MSFHDDLVAARHRGEAPGQVNYQAPPPPEAAPVVYEAVDPESGYPVVCGRCGALVPDDTTARHADWHARLGD